MTDSVPWDKEHKVLNWFSVWAHQYCRWTSGLPRMPWGSAIRHSALSSDCFATWHLRSVHISWTVPRSSWRRKESFHPICCPFHCACVSQSCCGLGGWRSIIKVIFVASLNVPPATFEMMWPAVKNVNWMGGGLWSSRTSMREFGQSWVKICESEWAAAVHVWVFGGVQFQSITTTGLTYQLRFVWSYFRSAQH